MTRDALHAKLYALQLKWLGWVPYQVREMLAGILVLPLLALGRLNHWSELGAFVVFGLLSIAYEGYMAPPKAADILWRQVGALVAWGGWVLG